MLRTNLLFCFLFSIIIVYAGTLQYLASWGYRALAIDLPGYGNSSLPVIDEKNAGFWLAKLIDMLHLSDFVLISPSMSGRFSIPYIIQSIQSKQKLSGFVPIAPVSTEQLTSIDMNKLTVKFCIIKNYFFVFVVVL